MLSNALVPQALSTNKMNNEQAAVLELLVLDDSNDKREERNERLLAYKHIPSSLEEEIDEALVVVFSLYLSNINITMQAVSSFSIEEFMELLEIFKTSIMEMTIQRGPNYKDTSMDMFFMPVGVFKNGETWYYNAAGLRRKILELKSASDLQLRLSTTRCGKKSFA